MRVAVIGTGNVGGTLADRLAEKGHDVVVAASSADSAEQAAKGMDCRAAESAAAAASEAEALILAVPAGALGEVADEIRPHVAGKPVIDVSNGPQFAQAGESLAESLQRELPEAKVVKAFNTAFAGNMAEPIRHDRPLDGFIAGDDPAAKATVAALVRDVGFEPLDVGELKNARALEGMAWINISLNMQQGWPWQSAWRLERNCPMAITRLNHAVLFVRDADAAADFYHRAFGFEELERPQGMRAVFMRSPAGGNHHDLGLFEVGAQAGRAPRGSVGLYHLAWEIDTIEGLAQMAGHLRELGALTGASDHGVSKSLYGRDPDGNEFEVMWQVPREAWGEYADQATIMPLDVEAELARWGAGASVQ